MITSSFIVTSYHYPTFTNINVRSNPPPPPTTFTYRRISAIDYRKFINDLNSSRLITNPPRSLPYLLDTYFSTCLSLLDQYAPFLTKTNKTSRTAPTPWIITLNFWVSRPTAAHNALISSPHTLFLIKNYLGMLTTNTRYLYPPIRSHSVHSLSTSSHPILVLFGKLSTKCAVRLSVRLSVFISLMSFN